MSKEYTYEVYRVLHFDKIGGTGATQWYPRDRVSSAKKNPHNKFNLDLRVDNPNRRQVYREYMKLLTQERQKPYKEKYGKGWSRYYKDDIKHHRPLLRGVR